MSIYIRDYVCRHNSFAEVRLTEISGVNNKATRGVVYLLRVFGVCRDSTSCLVRQLFHFASTTLRKRGLRSDVDVGLLRLPCGVKRRNVASVSY